MSLDPDLLPGHPHPQPDELLSSWIRRLAHANKTDYRFFVSRHVSSNAQIDVDRKLDVRMAERLAPKTVATREEITDLSLRRYAPPLSSPEEMQSKRPPWIIRYGYNVEKHAALSGSYPGVKPTTRTFYYPYCSECYEQEEPYIRRIWRLAFVTVCPAHERPLLDYDQPEEGVSEEVSSHALRKLGSFQQMLLETIRSGNAPEECHTADGSRLSAAQLFSGLHLLMKAAISAKGRFLRLYLASLAGRDFGRLESIHTAEHASTKERREVMMLLATIIVDWPNRLRFALYAGGLSYERLISRVEPSQRTRWLEGYAPEVDGRTIPTPPEPVEAGERTDRLDKLSLKEVFELQPITKEQFELLGVSEEDLSDARLSDQEWETVKSVFSGRRDYTRLLHNRTVLGLMRLMFNEGIKAENLPEAISGPAERATDRSKTKRAALLAEAFEQLTGFSV